MSRAVHISEKAMLALLEQREDGGPPREFTPEELQAYLRDVVAEAEQAKAESKASKKSRGCPLRSVRASARLVMRGGRAYRR